TDITPAQQRKVYEADLANRQEQIARLVRQIIAIEDEAIKKMPAADQRAAEGVGRIEVVKKVPMFLKEPVLGQYLKIKKEVGGLRKDPPPSQELALSINKCLARPPATTIQ